MSHALEEELDVSDTRPVVKAVIKLSSSSRGLRPSSLETVSSSDETLIDLKLVFVF